MCKVGHTHLSHPRFCESEASKSGLRADFFGGVCLNYAQNLVAVLKLWWGGIHNFLPAFVFAKVLRITVGICKIAVVNVPDALGVHCVCAGIVCKCLIFAHEMTESGRRIFANESCLRIRLYNRSICDGSISMRVVNLWGLQKTNRGLSLIPAVDLFRTFSNNLSFRLFVEQGNKSTLWNACGT